MVLSAVLILSFGNVTSAHKLGFCSGGGESSGYILNCGAPHGRAGTTNISTSDMFLPTAYQAYVDTGMARWNSTGVVNLTRATSSPNKIVTYSDSNGEVKPNLEDVYLNLFE